MKGSTLFAGLLALLIACGISFGAGYYVAREQGEAPGPRPVVLADTSLDGSPATDSRPLDAPTGQAPAPNTRPTDAASPQPANEAGEVTAKGASTVEAEQESAPPQPNPAAPRELEDQLKDFKKKFNELKPEDVDEFQNIFSGPPVDFTATVSGQVVDGAGLAVSGASVRASFSEVVSSGGEGRRVSLVMAKSSSDDGAEIATTDASGFFTAAISRKIPEKASLQVSLTANAEGSAESKQQTVTLKNGDSRENIKLILRGAGSVTGRVVDANGVGVAGVQVGLNPGGGRFVREVVEFGPGGGSRYSGATDAAGEFRIEGVAEGRYKFRLQGSGYRQVSGPTEVDVKPGESTRAPADFQVAVTSSLAVTFTDAGGNPVRGWVTLRFIGADGKVAKQMNGAISKDGLFEQNDPPAGSYDVEMQVWGYQKQTVRATFTEGQRYDIGVISLEPVQDDQSSGILLPGDDE